MSVPADLAYEVVQGAEMGRPPQLHCTVTAQDGEPVSATVRGSVVPIRSGRIRRP